MPFLVAKFGSRERVDALFERVCDAGRAYGIDYAFEKIALRANTLRAHRLIHWAQQRGDAELLVERLFVAQFQRGEHVGDIGILAAIAGECGYAVDEVNAYLASDEDAEAVRAMEAEFRSAGIQQVPTFVVDRRFKVVGAEDPEVLADAMRQALAGV
jgi:predicted DsbA family dithiol-disulfide isomerase